MKPSDTLTSIGKSRVTLAKPPRLTLMPDEIRLVENYRKCNDQCQRMMLGSSDSFVESPFLMRQPERTILRLIQCNRSPSDGGAK
jgi:hypothetical protein